MITSSAQTILKLKSLWCESGVLKALIADAESGKAAPAAAIPASTLDEEFELVKNAFFTLPDDQSGWLYHRWLLSNAMAAAQAARGGPEVW